MYMYAHVYWLGRAIILRNEVVGSYSDLKNPARAVRAFEPRPEKTGVKSQVSPGSVPSAHLAPKTQKLQTSRKWETERAFSNLGNLEAQVIISR